jgi:hypothetical protein
MRVTSEFTPMQDIKVDWLIRMALLVVLMTRSIHYHGDISSLLESLMVGEIGSMVDPGYLRGRLPYSLRLPLKEFVQFTLDNHSDSLGHSRCRSDFAALNIAIGRLANRTDPRKRKHTVSRVVSEILGGAPMEEATGRQQSLSERPSDDFRKLKHQLHMHHTIDIAPAYVALAARAYGADCAVDIMLGAGRCQRIPETHTTTPHTFVVRLWTSPFPRSHAYCNLRAYLRPDSDARPQPRPHSNLRTQRLPTIKEDCILDFNNSRDLYIPVQPIIEEVSGFRYGYSWEAFQRYKGLTGSTIML